MSEAQDFLRGVFGTHGERAQPEAIHAANEEIISSAVAEFGPHSEEVKKLTAFGKVIESYVELFPNCTHESVVRVAAAIFFTEEVVAH